MTESILNSAFLTNILREFTKSLTLGYTALVPEAMWLIKYFILIEIIFLGVYIAFGGSNLSEKAIKKILFISFYLWLIPNFQDLSYAVIKFFSYCGIKAGGSHISVKQLFDPSEIINVGFDITFPLFNVGSRWNLFDQFIKGLCGAIIIFTMFYIAWMIFLSILEFYLSSVIAVILLPFAIFKPLAYLSEKAIAQVFAMAIRFMAIALVINISWSTISSVAESLPDDYTLKQCFLLILVTGSIALFCKMAIQYALLFSGGSPHVTGSALLGAIAGTATSATSSQFQQGRMGQRSKKNNKQMDKRVNDIIEAVNQR